MGRLSLHNDTLSVCEFMYHNLGNCFRTAQPSRLIALLLNLKRARTDWQMCIISMVVTLRSTGSSGVTECFTLLDGFQNTLARLSSSEAAVMNLIATCFFYHQKQKYITPWRVTSRPMSSFRSPPFLCPRAENEGAHILTISFRCH